MKVVLLLVLVALSALSEPAGAEERRRADVEGPTLDQRSERRFDVAGIERRLKQHQPSVTVPEGRERNVVIGAENPELIMPSEAFARFLRMATHPDSNVHGVYRDRFDDYMRRFGFDDAWRRFEDQAADLSYSLNRQRDLANRKAVAGSNELEAIDQEISAVQDGDCRRRHRLLQWCRQHFGEPTFDAFLYEVIVPTMFVVNEYPITDREKERQRLLWREKGCAE